MGSGASTAHADVSGVNPYISLPVAELARRVKVYQNDNTGEILVLLEEDVKRILGSMDGWSLATHSALQKKYYDELLSESIDSSADNSQITSGMRSDSSLVPVEVPPLRNGPSKIKSLQVVAATPVRAPAKREYNDDSSDRLMFQADEKRGRTSPRTSGGSPVSKQLKYTPTPYMPPSSKLIRNDLTDNASIQQLLGYNKKRSGGVSASDEFKSFDNDAFSVSRHRTAARTRCSHCGETFPECAQNDLVKEHMEVCAEMSEIKRQLDEINGELQLPVSALSQSTHLMVQEILYNAIAQACSDIDEADSLNNRVLLLARRVMNINQSSTSDGRLVTVLRQDLVNQLNELLSMIDAELKADRPDEGVLKELDYYRVLLDKCYNQLKAKIAILLRYRKTQHKPSDYKFIRAIGKGGFGCVYLAQKTSNMKLCAIKVMSKQSIKDFNFELQILRERKALTKALQYPDSFVRMQCAFQTSTDLFLVMEYIPGGDCMTLLSTMHQFPEVMAQHIIVQVCVAVKHLHMHGVVHRDIKPDNVMITKRGHVKLADFGLVAPFTRQSSGHSESFNTNNSATVGNSIKSRSRRSSSKTSAFATGMEEQWLDDDVDLINTSLEKSAQIYNSSSSLILSKPNYHAEQVGNYNYSSPELVIRSPYDHTVDWWAVAVMLFHFLAGTTPFDDATRDLVEQNIVLFRVNWSFLPKTTSAACKDFIASIITKTVDGRLGYKSSDDVLDHRFFSDLDLARLYTELGPYYPLVEGKNGREFHVFAALTEGEAYDIPDFSANETTDMLNDEFVHYNYFK